MLKQKWCLIIAALTSVLASGQDQGSSALPSSPCSHPFSNQFDFWLGEWEGSWPGGQMGTPEGETGNATNSISKKLGDCVVFEQFQWVKGAFEGKSFSVYDPNRDVWQQTWVDNQGGYLVFSGKYQDGKMELRTAELERQGEKSISRMVFVNITENSFDWNWQRSVDGGKTWIDLWNIHYKRMQ